MTRQHPFGEGLPKTSVRFAEPPSVEGAAIWQFVLEEADELPAALVVTFAVCVAVSAVSPGNCRTD